jgi:CRP/FNR family transcriptional regulator, cyclic AMP receptor protein
MVHVDLLRRIPIFSKLMDEELVSLGTAMTRRVVDRGDLIISQGAEDRTICFLAEGRVKVALENEQGKELILGLLEEGSFFGELALITGERRSANVVATRNAVLFILSHEAFEQHSKSHTGFMRALLEALAYRVIKTSQRIGDIALCDVYHRVFNILVSLAERNADGSLVVQCRPTHQELASMAGTSREMVTRVLKALEEDALITADGKRLSLGD